MGVIDLGTTEKVLVLNNNCSHIFLDTQLVFTAPFFKPYIGLLTYKFYFGSRKLNITFGYNILGFY